MKRNDSDYPSPCCIELVFLLPVQIPVMLIRLAVSPSYRKVYREKRKPPARLEDTIAQIMTTPIPACWEPPGKP